MELTLTISFLKKIRTLVISALTLITVSGCFTGIERTPTIKDSSSSKNKTTISPEQSLLAEITPQPLGKWLPGKPFITTPGRLTLAYTPASIAATLNVSDTLRYLGMQPATRLSGDSITEIILQTPSSKELTTIIESPISVIQSQSVTLPFAIDIELVNNVRDALIGKTIWNRYPDKNGKKYQKQQITDVIPGNADFPFMIITSSDSILMVLHSRNASARTFENLFSLSNPRKAHPQISDKNWNLICNGQIALEMTREECRLALGTPAQIDRDASYSALYERWTYEDGKFLIFTDGLLTRFRL